MGLWGEHILPRLIDRVMRGPEFAELRRETVRGLSGRVLEVGFGSGLNLPHYPRAVESVVAIDPARVGRELAAARIEALHCPIEFVDADRGGYPLDSGSFDAVLTTWTLCTLPDARAALREMRRVLASEGRFHFLEHGRSPDPRTARWQRRITPLHRLWAGGCRLDVDIGALVRDADFEIESLDTFAFEKAGRLAGWTYAGTARP